MGVAVYPLLLLPLLGAAHSPQGSVLWHVDPITIKIDPQRAAPFASSRPNITLAGMRGECERAQIWLRAADADSELAGIRLNFSGGVANWTALQQGYVKTVPPAAGGPGWQGYTCLDQAAGDRQPRPCLGGWYPDPLFPPAADGSVVPLVPAAKTQPIFVQACIPTSATPGNFSGTVTVTGTVGSAAFAFTVPWTIEVWPITLPPLDSPSAFRAEIGWSDRVGWGGNDDPNSNLHAFFPTKSQIQIWDAWLPFLASKRTPPNQLYQEAPRPMEFYKRLAASGSRWMSLMDVSAPLQYFTPKVNYSQAYLQHVLDTLAPTVENATRLGIVDRMYVYGFDEFPQEQNATVYAVFGAIKQRWPALRTVGAIDWSEMPNDLPLDVWVDLYTDYFCESMAGSACAPTATKEAKRQRWLASGKSKEYWWYWCLQPHDPRFMNTFVEYPAIQARMLFWLASLHGVNGMMYYQNDVWATEGVAARCGSPARCKPCDRGANQTAFSEWDPASYPGPQPGSLNGDGSLTYPGPDGPLSTIRLENIADGIEDVALWAQLGINKTTGLSNGADLIQQIVSNGTDRVEDPALMERVRRQAAHRIIAAAKTDDETPREQTGGSTCEGELLYNGICLKGPWPPAFNTTYFCKKCNTTYHGSPPSEPRYPPYIRNGPPVINISIGRQLFVDTFLIESMFGLQLSSHAATWEEQVLKATEPWEEQTGTVPYNCDYDQRFPMDNGWSNSNNTPTWFECGWPQGPRAVGYAGTFQGAVVYDEQRKLFRMWYSCGMPAENANDPQQGLCHAESHDGRDWVKRLVGTGNNTGTNKVYTEAFDSAIVWQDYTEPIGSPRRWVMASVPKDLGFGHFRLRQSADGLNWTVAVNSSGPIQDASSIFFNPFRKKWVYSIKQGFTSLAGTLQYRARAYKEADDLMTGATSWTHMYRGPNGTHPWTSADLADPPWPYNSSMPAQLYNLNCNAYESVMICLFAIFRGFVNVAGTTDGTRTSGEHNEVYLGFSRDGFHFWRQYDGTAVEGGVRPRLPFMPQTWPQHSWRYSDIQGSGGGFLVVNDTLNFFSSGAAGAPYDFILGGNTSTGVATLRRDGFTSVESMMDGSPGLLTTRPLIFDSTQTHLFVNVVIQPGGFLQVAVLDVETQMPLHGFPLNGSSIAGLPPNSAIEVSDKPNSPPFDNTSATVTWPTTSTPTLASVAGRPVRLQFRMNLASLYSFWVATSACGASGGYLGNGGPRSTDGRDLTGNC